MRERGREGGRWEKEREREGLRVNRREGTDRWKKEREVGEIKSEQTRDRERKTEKKEKESVSE